MQGRELTLRFSPFALESLEGAAARQGLALATFLRHAVLYLLAERSDGRLSACVPRFARGFSEGDPLSVSLSLENSDWARLEQVAGKDELPVAELVSHAATLYLADSESGRVGRRLLLAGRSR